MYSIEHIAYLIQADANIAYVDASVSHLLIDSRKIVFPGTSLFFALRTSHRNGHDFIKEVYERGVRNFLVEKQFDVSGYERANFLKVEDTLKALQQLAAHHRSQFKYPVIGITGSNGKTIVKEWLYQLLCTDKKIIRSPRSYNSQVGVPLSVWQMTEEYELGIFEAGISQQGEMAALAKIIQPNIGIITNIGEAHNDGFKNPDNKAKEKLSLFDNCELLFYNADDEIIKRCRRT